MREIVGTGHALVPNIRRGHYELATAAEYARVSGRVHRTRTRGLPVRPADRNLAAGTVAVEFGFAGDCLRIVNGLDENRIEVGAAQPDFIRHRLGR